MNPGSLFSWEIIWGSLCKNWDPLYGLPFSQECGDPLSRDSHLYARVEVFATGIKLESSLFGGQSRDQGGLQTETASRKINDSESETASRLACVVCTTCVCTV